jgi:hypothetical protein
MVLALPFSQQTFPRFATSSGTLFMLSGLFCYWVVEKELPTGSFKMCYHQCSKFVGTCWQTIPELPFALNFHTGTYQYILAYTRLSFSIFLTVYPCFAFKTNTVLPHFHFERWLLLRVTEFFDFFHRLIFMKRRFGNWMFPSSGVRHGTPALLGPL